MKKIKRYRGGARKTLEERGNYYIVKKMTEARRIIASARMDVWNHRLLFLPSPPRSPYIRDSLWKAMLELAYGGDNERAAILSKCYECVGFNKDRIKKCNRLDCPLWLYSRIVEEHGDIWDAVPSTPYKDDGEQEDRVKEKPKEIEYGGEVKEDDKDDKNDEVF